MGEYWAEEAAKGYLNISDRPLIFIEPEGEHAAAAVTAGLSMTGLRSANFSSGQGIAYMHESLYAAVGKRLTYVLNIGARAMTKSTLNVHAGHDDYHAIDDTGFFQLFARNAQHAADFNIIAHKVAELALTPGIVAQDGFLTTHLIESLRVPERALIKEFLGRPDDIIDTPTPAQRMIYGDKRRRIPELWDVDNPLMAGIVQNQDSYMQSVAAQRPYFFDHIQPLTDQAFADFASLTGREYARVMTYLAEDADYLILGQGSLIPSAEVVADYLRKTRNIKVGVVDLTMFRPFPSDLISRILKGKKGVAILERLDQPLASDLPIAREVRSTVAKCMENGSNKKDKPYPELESYSSTDLPAIYSGSFGMGSRDLQPEGIIGAIENMLPDGKHKKLFYLSIDFIREEAITPKQQGYQESITDAYPHVKELAIHGSENPNLMPKGAITVRFHSVGGWGAITTGKNLAMTLFDLLDYHIKANPKYGSEKKGQPTTYYLAAAPEPIRVNCEYYFVDVVLSPDPNVLNHTNALAGLKKGGTFIIQSDRPKAEEVWADIPRHYQKFIVDNEIHIHYIDGFKIAREEATDPELQLRMQGIAFQGGFFAASPVMKQAGLTQATLLKAIEDQIQHKFGGKGQRVVDDNMRVVKRGFDEIHEIPDSVKVVGATSGEKTNGQMIPPIPSILKHIPQSESTLSDIHRFWEQTGNFYQRGMGNDNLTDPFIGLSVMPAASSLFRDMTGIRFEHPEWIPNNCTACGDCYTICPDTAIPGLVSNLSDVLNTVVDRVKKSHGSVEQLPGAVRKMESKVRELFGGERNGATVNNYIQDAIDVMIDESGHDATLEKEFTWFREELGDFDFALTRPYFDLHEKNKPGSGGLFSITVNPTTCKGCMECVAVCNDDALRPIKQTEDSVATLRKEWDLWSDLPTTPEQYSRIDDLEEKIGALQTILLNKEAYLSFASGDGACLGCSEKSVVHLFVATVESLLQPRVKKHMAHLDSLCDQLEKHIQNKLMSSVNVADAESMAKIIAETHDHDLTMSELTQRMEKEKGSEPIDQDWLREMTQLLAKLKQLKCRVPLAAPFPLSFLDQAPRCGANFFSRRVASSRFSTQGGDEEIPLTPQHPLGRAGGPSGAQHVEIVRRGAHGRGSGRLVAEQLVVPVSTSGQVAARLVLHLHQEVEGGESGRDPFDDRCERRVEDDGSGALVGEQRHQFVVDIAVEVHVERGDRARRSARRSASRNSIPLWRYSARWSCPDSEPGQLGPGPVQAQTVLVQHVGEAVGIGDEVAVATPILPVDDALAVGHGCGRWRRSRRRGRTPRRQSSPRSSPRSWPSASTVAIGCPSRTASPVAAWTWATTPS